MSNTEQTIADIEALPDGYLLRDWEVVELDSLMTDDLKLLVTELRRLRDALAAAEEGVGHYADTNRFICTVNNFAVEREYMSDDDDANGYDHAVATLAEIKRIKGE